MTAFVSAAVLSTAGARANEPDPGSPGGDRSPAEVDAFLAAYAPAPVDGPALRLPFSPTRLHVDASFASTDDLSVLPYIAGKGSNVRFAAGGSWRWRRFAFSGELPFVQATAVDVTALMNQPPQPQDAHQTTWSLGDLRLGADWTDHLTDAVVGGFGFRTRLATHTTGFTFHLADGSTERYAFPYYFHLEPTVILGAAFGRFTLVMNQGAIVMLGPDGSFSGFYIHVPTIAFWDAAYAASYAPINWLAASVELATDIQLNHVGGLDFTKFNDVRSAWIAPALQLHFSDYRIDLVARFGLSESSNLFGIMEFAGKSSYTLRVSRPF